MEDQGIPVSATPEPVAPRSGVSGGKVALVVGAVVLLGMLGACVLLSFALLTLDSGSKGSGNSIALIHLNGAISGTTATTGGATPEKLIAEIKAAEDDDGVKAILLRIDSPGGTVAASQEIATAVARAKKPVIASIGDVGASGAYMVASQCDRIVAMPTSSVGSIGVVLEVPNLEGLLGKLGVQVVVITEGKLKDVGSPFRGMTAEERKLIQAQMKIAYDEFIGIVAKGRKLPQDKVREMATGWVWMGVEAKKLGLVDELGNYTDAVKAAAKAGGIKGEPDVVDFDEHELPRWLSTVLAATSRTPSLDALDAARLTDGTGSSATAVPK